jgi:hypothetical protein
MEAEVVLVELEEQDQLQEVLITREMAVMVICG